MLKKIIPAILAILVASNISYSQVTGSHAFGTSGFVRGPFDESFSQGITYASRLNFLFFGSEHTLSVGTTATIFPFFASIGYDSKPLFTFDIPLTIDANFGHASDDDADSDFGGFVGLGGCYNNLWDYDYENNRYATGRGGIVFNGGIRFDSYMIGSYTIRGSYMLNFGRGHNVIGVNILVNLGDY